jgi:flavin reductase (DIM6/NTAB) family NADH-FMN oxidoreductase RutF
LQSGRDLDKFTGLSWTVSPNGIPLLAETAGWLDCRIEAVWDAGDRTIFLAEIVAEACPKPGPVLTMKRVLQLATPDRLQQLKACRSQDAVIEAALITQWRQSNCGTKSA